MSQPEPAAQLILRIGYLVDIATRDDRAPPPTKDEAATIEHTGDSRKISDIHVPRANDIKKSEFE